MLSGRQRKINRKARMDSSWGTFSAIILDSMFKRIYKTNGKCALRKEKRYLPKLPMCEQFKLKDV